MTYTPLLAIAVSIALIIVLILRFKIQPFLALLIGSLLAGMLAGADPAVVLKSVTTGMGNTLGFVATVIGLGALFGTMLEHSGGTEAIAKFLLKTFGIKNAPTAMLLAGFVISIPVFFDVAFIILTPVLYALQRSSGKSLLLFGIPLLAGLAITHSFIPPTPGPVAVADIIQVDLGWVVIAGLLAGIPTAIVSGLIWGKIIANKIHVKVPEYIEEKHLKNGSKLPNPGIIFAIISIPIVLIMLNTLSADSNASYSQTLSFIGHPFVALIIANLLAWYFLGIRRGVSKEELLKASSQSLTPTGVIILLTGAGGAFKEVLINTGSGKIIAESMSEWGIPLLLFGFLVAAAVRILQGSATVAMITAAGVTSSVVSADTSDFGKALLVIAIASGATILSHVNDSGFWLVNRYFGLTEKQTLASWTIMTTLLGLTGLISCILLNMVF